MTMQKAGPGFAGSALNKSPLDQNSAHLPSMSCGSYALAISRAIPRKLLSAKVVARKQTEQKKQFLTIRVGKRARQRGALKSNQTQIEKGNYFLLSSSRTMDSIKGFNSSLVKDCKTVGSNFERTLETKSSMFAAGAATSDAVAGETDETAGATSSTTCEASSRISSTAAAGSAAATCSGVGSGTASCTTSGAGGGTVSVATATAVSQVAASLLAFATSASHGLGATLIQELFAGAETSTGGAGTGVGGGMTGCCGTTGASTDTVCCTGVTEIMSGITIDSGEGAVSFVSAVQELSPEYEEVAGAESCSASTSS